MVEKIDLKKSQERINLDSFQILDNINFDEATQWMKDPAANEVAGDILKDVLDSSLAEEVRKKAKMDPEFVEGGATSFDAMLDTSIGTVYQRLQKWYMKTGDPEKAKRIYETIGVDRYRNTIKWIVLDLLKMRGVAEQASREGKNTNYTIATPSLNSLIDFATNKTLWSERIHLAGAAGTVILASYEISEGSLGDAAFYGAFFLLNTYCVLAQRYTRTQLGALINKMIERQRSFDPMKYANDLGIRLPAVPNSNAGTSEGVRK